MGFLFLKENLRPLACGLSQIDNFKEIEKNLVKYLESFGCLQAKIIEIN